ncbi:hypothetical protein [Microbacterium caowuchunii]|uniref:hypothetical protein n=1 Tax=Microbacterium caowuchunii TaxID=2614638 RepID=UPI00177DB1F9|nr:hypothetical protein [Microbacterium caowuchunii]
MTNNSFIPQVPLGDGDATEDAVREVDGDEVLDQDIDDNQVDSAEADRLAAEAPTDQD